MSISNYFISKEKSHSTPDLTSSAPKRGCSPQEEFSVKKLKFAMNENLTEKERKRTYSEAPMCVKLLFHELYEAIDEIADVKVIGIRPMAPVLNTGPLEGI